MAEETPKRPFNWRRLIAVLVGIVLFIMVCIAILAVLPSLFPQWQREAEIARDVRDTFPHLCPVGLVIKDCWRGGCFFSAPPGAEWYEVSCRGADSAYGPALTLDAMTCVVTPRSLTLLSSLLMDIPANWNGKLRVCPASSPLAVTPAR